MFSRIPASLLALALGGFGIGLTEFVVMGLLPDIAVALDITIPEAGRLISAYALGVVVGAPTLVLLAGSQPPKRLLIALMVVFTAFNGLSALAPSYPSLLLVRFLSGLPHGAYFGVAAVVAARIAGPAKAASAFSIVLGGLTVCNIVGVPIASYVGHHVNFRASFAMVAAVGLLTITAISVWTPATDVPRAHDAPSPLVIFKRAELWSVILLASVGFGGFFAWFSYIAPLLMKETRLGASSIPWLMSLAGIGMTVGNYAGGKLSDRLTPVRAVTTLMTSMTLVMALNGLLATHAWAMVPLVFVTAANAMAMGAPIQMLLIGASRESELLGSSVGQAAFNMGNSLGAFLAGVPLTMGLRYASAEWVGSAMSLVGVLIALRLGKQLQQSESAAAASAERLSLT